MLRCRLDDVQRHHGWCDEAFPVLHQSSFLCIVNRYTLEFESDARQKQWPVVVALFQRLRAPDQRLIVVLLSVLNQGLIWGDAVEEFTRL